MKKLYCFLFCFFLFLIRSGVAFSSELLNLQSATFPITVTNPEEIPEDWFETNDCVIKKSTETVIWSEGYISKEQVDFEGNSSDFFLCFDTGQFKRITVYYQNEDGNWYSLGKTGNLVHRFDRSVPSLIYAIRVKSSLIKNTTKIRIKSEVYFHKPFSVHICSSQDSQNINDKCLIGYSLFLGFQLLSILIFLFMFKFTKNKLFLVSSMLSIVFSLFVIADSDMDSYLQFVYIIRNGDYFNYNIVLLVVMSVLLFFKENMQFHYFGRDRDYGNMIFWFLIAMSVLVIAILLLPFSTAMFIFGQLVLLLSCGVQIVFLIYVMIVNPRRRFYAFMHILIFFGMFFRTIMFILRTTYPDFVIFSILDNDYLITYICFAIFFTGDSFLYLGFFFEKKSKRNSELISENDKNAELAEMTFTSLEMIGENVHKALETIRHYDLNTIHENKTELLVVDKTLSYIEIYNNVQNAISMERRGIFKKSDNGDVIHLRPFIDHIIDTYEYQFKYKQVTVNSQVKIDSKIVVQTNRMLIEGMLRLIMIVVDSNSFSNSTVYIKSGFSNGSFSFSITFDCNAPHEEEFNSLLTLNPKNTIQEQLLSAWGVNLHLISGIVRILQGTFSCYPAKNGITIRVEMILKSSIFYPKIVFENKKVTTVIKKPEYEACDKQTVLIADFSLGYRIAMADRLNKDFSVYTEGNGQDAFEILYTKKIDLVLLSERISVMTIETFMESFFKNPDFAHIPLFVVVDFLTPEKSLYYRERGAVMVLENPLLAEDFILTIKNTLRLVNGNEGSEKKTDSSEEVSFVKSRKPSKNKTILDGLSEAQDVEFTKAGLTKKEKLIAVYISQGMSDKEISDITGISSATVAVHNRNIFKKLGIHKRSELLNK